MLPIWKKKIRGSPPPSNLQVRFFDGRPRQWKSGRRRALLLTAPRPEFRHSRPFVIIIIMIIIILVIIINILVIIIRGPARRGLEGSRGNENFGEAVGGFEASAFPRPEFAYTRGNPGGALTPGPVVPDKSGPGKV